MIFRTRNVTGSHKNNKKTNKISSHKGNNSFNASDICTWQSIRNIHYYVGIHKAHSANLEIKDLMIKIPKVTTLRGAQSKN